MTTLDLAVYDLTTAPLSAFDIESLFSEDLGEVEEDATCLKMLSTARWPVVDACSPAGKTATLLAHTRTADPYVSVDQKMKLQTARNSNFTVANIQPSQECPVVATSAVLGSTFASVLDCKSYASACSTSEDNCSEDESRHNHGASPKRRKNRKPTFWSMEEHRKFLDGLKKYGLEKSLGAGGADLMAMHMGTRSILQIKSHAQKHFAALKSDKCA